MCGCWRQISRGLCACSRAGVGICDDARAQIPAGRSQRVSPVRALAKYGRAVAASMVEALLEAARVVEAAMEAEGVAEVASVVAGAAVEATAAAAQEAAGMEVVVLVVAGLVAAETAGCRPPR